MGCGERSELEWQRRGVCSPLGRDQPAPPISHTCIVSRSGRIVAGGRPRFRTFSPRATFSILTRLSRFAFGDISYYALVYVYHDMHVGLLRTLPEPSFETVFHLGRLDDIALDMRAPG